MKRMIAFTIAVIILITNTYAFENSAKAIAIVDGESKQIIYSKNGEEKLPMASTTKIMTALVAIEAGDLEREVTIAKEATAVEGSSIYLKEGEVLTLYELLNGLMLESGNDSAVAIAMEIGGSVEGFARLMNQKANELGLKNTNFVNPNGLSADGHYTTANDLAILGAYAIENPIFREITSKQKEKISYYNQPNKYRFLQNANKMIAQYDGANGIKTGYTKAAGRCLVSSATRDDLTIVVSTLNDPNDWQDHKNGLDYGFSKVKKEKLVEIGGFSENVPVVGGKSSFVLCENMHEGFRNVIEGREGEVEYSMEISKFLYAPIKKGDQVGRGIILENDVEIISVPIYAMADVEGVEVKEGLWSVINKIISYLLLLFKELADII